MDTTEQNDINCKVVTRPGEYRKNAKEALHDAMKRFNHTKNIAEKHKEATVIIMRSSDWKNITPEEEAVLWSFFVNL